MPEFKMATTSVFRAMREVKKITAIKEKIGHNKPLM
jgi:hypothetical protein